MIQNPALTSLSVASPDIELVRRFVAGDESAFVEIMRRHRGKILTVAQSLLHNYADAEEIAQDTFVRAYRNLAGFRGDSSLATWLYRIASNLARNRYWYFSRRHQHSTFSFDRPLHEENDMTLADLIASPGSDPARESSCAEFSVLVAEAMEKLDARHREILDLRNLKNLSYEEIARGCGITLGTVKSRIARAREHLRARLVEACPEFASEAGPSEWLETSRESGRMSPACA